MAWINPLYEEHQRQRWLRHDWQRFLTPAGLEAEKRAAEERARAVRAAEQKAFEDELWQVRRDLDALKVELAARRAARRQEAEALRRRSDLAFERFLSTFKRYAEQQKAGFNPAQLRDDQGKWTDTGSGNSKNPERIRLAGEIPTNDPPDIPKERPATSERRTEVVKNVARWLGRFGGPLAKIAGAAYWLYEYDAHITASLDPPKSLEELQRAVASPKAGYEIHHIVEQTPAEQDGYRRSLIDGPDNLVRIPTLKHREITAWYQTTNDDFGNLSPREYLRGKTWEERTQVGLKALIDVGVLKP